MRLFRLVAGYYSGRLYKTMKGSNWKRTAALVRLCAVRTADLHSVLVDSDTLPIDRMRARFDTQCHHLGKALVGCGTVFYHAVHTEHVAGDIVSIGLSWLLLWLP